MINAFPSMRIVDGYFIEQSQVRRVSWCLPGFASQFTCYNQTFTETERIHNLSALYDFIFAIII